LHEFGCTTTFFFDHIDDIAIGAGIVLQPTPKDGQAM
jgi:hypothetical protein